MSKVFQGKLYIEPGSGVVVITNAPPSPNLLASGIIGVIGESDGGLTFADNIIYSSDDPAFFRSVLRGGVSKRAIEFMFNPSPDLPGANRVKFVRAQAATVATDSTINDVAPAALVLTSKDKGAYLSDAALGLGYTLLVGVVDTAKHIFNLYLDGEIIYTSPEILTFNELRDAINSNAVAASVVTAAVTGTGTTPIAIGERHSVVTIFTGGTSPAMTGGNIDSALTLLRTQDINILFIASPTAADYVKGLTFINSELEYPAMLVAGGVSAETVAQAKARALTLNSEKAVLCYPGVIKPKEDGSGDETLSPMYHAALVAGLMGGAPPELPLTWKKLLVNGFEFDLSRSQREDLIVGGVLASRNIPGVGFGVNKGVNTLQTNGSMIYQATDGTATSPEISIIRIKQQLIRELIVNSAQLFIGGNVATVSKEDILNFTVAYLKSRTTTNTASNLLVDYGNVTATLNDDAWEVGFEFTPNTPINHVFYTAAMLRP